MRKAGPQVAILLVILAACADAAAWTPQTRMRMVDDAVNMMPRSLRGVLKSNIGELKRGTLVPLAEEGSPAHLPPEYSGSLPDEVAARSTALVDAVNRQAPFSEVARLFGGLAHFVADAGFPPGSAGPEAGDRYRHFGNLVEGWGGKIRFVFYGHGDPDLERGDPAAFTSGILARAARQDAELARAYRQAEEHPHPSAFDDRSVPFAIGSLAYSRTVTDIVRAWMDAWGRANGDTGRTPYYEPKRRP